MIISGIVDTLKQIQVSKTSSRFRDSSHTIVRNADAGVRSQVLCSPSRTPFNQCGSASHRLIQFTIVLFCVLLIGSRTSLAQPSFVTKDGYVEFQSSVPLHSFTGKSDLLNGRISLADSTVDFYVDLSTLKTGNGKRDKDMRKTLNTKEYPFAEFFGKLTTPFDPSSSAEQVVSVAGTFSIHGITRDLEVSGTLRAEGDNLLLSATWEISNEAYDIVPPKLLIMKVDDIQTVSIRASLKKETP